MAYYASRTSPHRPDRMYEDEKYLLTKRRVEPEDDLVWDGYWQIPTGTVHFGEDIKTSITREARVELGIAVELTRTLAVPEKVDETKGWHGDLWHFYVKT